MPEPSHQTIRLSRGSHLDARQGACVMELASMLAGQRFSDHPRAVCPVVAAVLRAYNDGTNDDRRQDLYPLASAVVGTRDWRARRDRLARCETFLAAWLGRRRIGSRARTRMLYRACLAYAAAADDASHSAFLRFVEELIGTPAVRSVELDLGGRSAGAQAAASE
jgi:hypothetical protein